MNFVFIYCTFLLIPDDVAKKHPGEHPNKNLLDNISRRTRDQYASPEKQASYTWDLQMPGTFHKCRVCNLQHHPELKEKYNR